MSISSSSEAKEETKLTKVAGAPTPGQAWDEQDVATTTEGLWLPSAKVVAGGAKGETRSNSLCEAGILAKQGNLQPLGKVVCILENNHRVSYILCFCNFQCFKSGISSIFHMNDELSATQLQGSTSHHVGLFSPMFACAYRGLDLAYLFPTFHFL